MPYHAIPTRHIASRDTENIIHRADLMLSDVYTMCCKHPLKRTKAGGCNFSATLVLMCIVDALAAHVYDKTRAMPRKNGVQKIRFETLIVDKLPWDSTWMDKLQAAEFLYRECRNPLAHELGRDSSKHHSKSNYSQPVATIWGDIRPQKIANVDVRQSWPAKWPIICPDRVLVKTTGEPARLKVTVVALYWAVKRMVREFAQAAVQ